jgi:hypothetical protein
MITKKEDLQICLFVIPQLKHISSSLERLTLVFFIQQKIEKTQMFVTQIDLITYIELH